MTPAMYGVKRVKRPRGSVAPSRTAAIGGTRVARRAGKSPASERHERADEQRDDDRARGEDRLRLRQVEVERLEELAQADGETEAGRRGR